MVAVVGNVSISEADVAREADTFALQTALFNATKKFASNVLHVEQVENESLRRFLFAHLRRGRCRGPNTPTSMQHAPTPPTKPRCARTTVALIDHATLQQLARASGVDPTTPGVIGLEEQNQKLKAAILQARGAQKGPKVSDATLTEQLKRELNQALDDALWMPCQAALDKALSPLRADTRANARRFLTLATLYAGRYSLRAAHTIASELANNGTASKLCALIKVSGKTAWSVGDLHALAQTTPSLAASINPCGSNNSGLLIWRWGKMTALASRSMPLVCTRDGSHAASRVAIPLSRRWRITRLACAG